MLLSPSDGRSCDDIMLPDGVRVVLGRGPRTKIADKRCSREHLALTADYARQQVLVEQMGPNPSQIKGCAGNATGLLHTGQSKELRVADTPGAPSLCIGFLEGKFEYTLKPVGSPPDAAASRPAQSQSRSDGATSGDTRKRSAAATLDDFVSVKPKRHAPDGASDSGAAASAMPRRPAEGSNNGDGEGGAEEASVSEKLRTYQAKMKSVEEHQRRQQEQADTAPQRQRLGDQDVAALASDAATSDSGPAVPAKLPADDDGGTSGATKRSSKPCATSFTKCSEGVKEGWAQPFDHLYVYATRGLNLGATAKVASFDLDGTLIVTASGKKWPENKDDWTLLSASIPARLQQLHRDAYTIVVFTNQHGLSKGTFTIGDFKLKIEAIAKKLGVPMLVLTATGRDVYRKPAPGMWDYLLTCIAASSGSGGGGGSALSGCSLYVGDAAGRPDGWAPKKKKDFACTDRLFALNLGLRFHTPEEYFLGHSAAPYALPKFSPAKLLKEGGPLLTRVAATAGEVKSSGSAVTEPPCLASPVTELVLLVGYPASGKSHFAQAHLADRGYVVVNRDTLGTWQKCVKACDEALSGGRSVVIDNTNPDVATREKYIACARRHSVTCRCFVLDVSHEQALHNERFRQITGPETHSPINDMVMNMHKSKFKEPELSEGFVEIVRVRFVPSFASAAHERLYGMYLV